MKLATVFGAFSAFSSRVMTPWLVVSLIMGRALFVGNDLDVLDDDRSRRNVLVVTLVAGWHGGDLVDDVHAVDDLAKNRVAVAALGRGAEIEESVVLQVDEELHAGRGRIGRAGHGDRAAAVLQAVVGLVLQ